MIRAFPILIILLAGCSHLPARSGITPDSLSDAALVSEGWCPWNEPLRYCKTYMQGDRALIAIHDAFGGQLVAIGEWIGEHQVIIRWTAPEQDGMPEDLEPGVIL